MAADTDKRTAAITGAAGGLGAAFARKLAQRGYDLVVIDRRDEDNRRLADELMRAHGIKAEAITANLTEEAAVKGLAQRLAAMPTLELLVNNAGFGLAKYVVDADIERHLDMIRVHVLASVRLTCTVLPGMVQRNRGAIINVSSLCAWTPCAGVVPYSSTKAYLTTFSLALQDELRGTNVRIQALCPGFVHTGFHDTEDMRNFDPQQIPRFLWLEADDVAECSLKHLSRKRVIVIPGLVNRVLGRLMQMPLFQPLVRTLVRQPHV